MSIPIFSTPKGIPDMIAITRPGSMQRQLDATHLVELLHAFLETKRSEIAEKSHTNYQIDLQPFITWWEAQDRSVLDAAGVAAFLAYLRKDYRNSFGKPATPQVMWREDGRH